MAKMIKLITAFLWGSLVLPFFIGMGGIHALDLNDNVGGAVAIFISVIMFATIGGFLLSIYLNWYNPKKALDTRVDFAESILIAFAFVGVTVSIPLFFLGVAIPTDSTTGTVMLATSLPMILMSLYVIWGFLIPESKKF